MQAPDVFSVDFGLAHVDCVCHFLGFFLFGVELDVPSRDYEVVYFDGNFGSLNGYREVAIVSKFLSQWSFFGFSDFAEYLLDVTGREGGSTSHSDLSLHQVEEIFCFQA